ncbi:MAG: HAD family hydrolase [Clostridia bacterium]|nr:HAD family hydrolase [Clostridia bacterium]
MNKLLLFDLDGTLLRTDKTISEKTLAQLERCRQKNCLIGVSTSRGEQNCLSFIGQLRPDVLIASGGALVKKHKQIIYKAVFTPERSRELIQIAREICGETVEITMDTPNGHYWNYKNDPRESDQSWGDSIWTDFHDFSEETLKMCVEIFDEEKANQLTERLVDCDAVRFSDGEWYKYTKAGVTKEHAIDVVCQNCNMTPQEIIAFGDDFADIGMLRMAGIGVAMGNAVDEVKAIADVVIGKNDEDGIAEYLRGMEDPDGFLF